MTVFMMIHRVHQNRLQPCRPLSTMSIDLYSVYVTLHSITLRYTIIACYLLNRIRRFISFILCSSCSSDASAIVTPLVQLVNSVKSIKSNFIILRNSILPTSLAAISAGLVDTNGLFTRNDRWRNYRRDILSLRLHGATSTLSLIVAPTTAPIFAPCINTSLFAYF